MQSIWGQLQDLWGICDRWKADMSSDSWLSKNVRPGTLVYLLTAYLIFALLDGYGYKISESYVNLLGQWEKGKPAVIWAGGLQGIDQYYLILVIFEIFFLLAEMVINSKGWCLHQPIIC